MAKGFHSDPCFRDYDDDNHHDPDYRAGGWSSCVIPKQRDRQNGAASGKPRGRAFFDGAPWGRREKPISREREKPEWKAWLKR